MDQWAREKAFEESMEGGIPLSERAIPFVHAAVDRLCDSADGSRRITIGRNRSIFLLFHLLLLDEIISFFLWLSQRQN